MGDTETGQEITLFSSDSRTVIAAGALTGGVGLVMVSIEVTGAAEGFL